MLTRLSGLLEAKDKVSGVLQPLTRINLELPRIALVSPTQHYSLPQSYLASSTILNLSNVNKNEAWIEVKQILLRHFLPDNYQKLAMIK